jgi:hypothetical protein
VVYTRRNGGSLSHRVGKFAWVDQLFALMKRLVMNRSTEEKPTSWEQVSIMVELQLCLRCNRIIPSGAGLTERLLPEASWADRRDSRWRERRRREASQEGVHLKA